MLRREAVHFAKFCAVGAIGFATDAGILYILMHAVSFGPLLARAISFPAAVLATFTLNRAWTFKRSVSGRVSRRIGLYYGVQGLGFLCNMMVYAAAILTLPPRFSAPIIALTLASASALMVNYMGSRTLVFPTTLPGRTHSFKRQASNMPRKKDQN
jgi:putative flippase GtrA